MNTKDRPTISIPTFLTEAFRTAALESGNGERIWLDAEEAAGQHVESVFSAGCLTEDAVNLFAPIQKSTHPITIYSLSPHYTPNVIRQLCIFQAPGSTTVLRSVGEESHIYLIDTEETPPTSYWQTHRSSLVRTISTLQDTFSRRQLTHSVEVISKKPKDCS